MGLANVSGGSRDILDILRRKEISEHFKILPIWPD
jgi:hypothetical protein